MRPMRVASIAMLGMCLAGMIVRADDAGDRRAIQDLYKKHVEAFKRRDVKGMLALLTPDFTSKSQNGELNTLGQLKSSLLSQTSRIRAIKEYSCTVTSLQLKEQKDRNAYAETKILFSGTVADGKSKPHEVSETATTKDLLIRNASGEWKVRHSDILTFVATIDGKKVNVK